MADYYLCVNQMASGVFDDVYIFYHATELSTVCH